MSQIIFLVEGDAESSKLARHYLETAGYVVRPFATADIMEQAERGNPSIILTAMLLPDGSGMELCRKVRENPLLSDVPVIFMVDENAERQRVLAMNSGGADSIVKPFGPRELVARVQSVLQRIVRVAPPSGETADLIIDSSAMKMLVRGVEVPTTSLEFRLIEYLARHRGQVFTRDLLLDAVWGDMQFVTPRSVDACIRRIREKIEPDRAAPTYLKTVRGVGYRLDAIAVWQLAASSGCNCAACTAPPGTPKPTHSALARRKRHSRAN
jgi:two-component system phosphate regulon response regulator PhoB